MRHNLFDHVNIKPENTYIPNGMEEDVDKECTRYNSIIHQLGGIDLQLLGIGNNGHIGFNEPSDTFAKETHCVELTKTTIQANARFLIPLMKFLLTHIRPESKILWRQNISC